MNHLECVTSLRNKWYWYLLLLFLCLAVSNTIGAIPLSILMVVYRFNKGTDMGDLSALANMDLSVLSSNLNIIFAVIFFSFVILLIAAMLLIKLFHKRSWKEVINGTNRVRWSRFFFGFLVWGIISLIIFTISYFTDPEVINFRFDPLNFFVLVIIALLFVPLQASAEEFLFRGYLAQGIASWTKSRWWAIIIPSILFGLMHTLNPEIKEYGFFVMMPQYIFLGLMFGIMSILDDGIELAMGVHTVNNLFGTTLVTYKASAVKTYALFEITELNPAEELLPLVITGIVLLSIFSFKYKWNFKILNQKVKLKGID